MAYWAERLLKLGGIWSSARSNQGSLGRIRERLSQVEVGFEPDSAENRRDLSESKPNTEGVRASLAELG
eukprot:72641-Rhodomonas_salina.1